MIFVLFGMLVVLVMIIAGSVQLSIAQKRDSLMVEEKGLEWYAQHQEYINNRRESNYG